MPNNHPCTSSPSRIVPGYVCELLQTNECEFEEQLLSLLLPFVVLFGVMNNVQFFKFNKTQENHYCQSKGLIKFVQREGEPNMYSGIFVNY